jgi:YidC/Oxa1 family membrane protein insertase
MLNLIKRFISEWQSMGAFNTLSDQQRELVFYAESASDWPHFEEVVLALLKNPKIEINYITSDPKDPILTRSRTSLPADAWGRIRSFCIGDGTVRTLWFKDLRCKVCVITLPDLEKYQLKRSTQPVHYLYLYHSINSTHRVYRESAFDAYDTILSVGPHHTAEIRKTEEVYGLKPKKIVEHGYGRLDSLFEKQRKSRENYVPSPGSSKKIVLAPSWGECSFVEHAQGEAIIEKLLSGGHQLSVRLHPMTVRHSPGLPARLEKRFADAVKKGRFRVVTDMSEQLSLAEADVMMSDWSGASFDFAFGLERPVLFVDTTPKINNPAWEKVGMEPIESFIRTEIGAIVQPSALDELDARIRELTENRGTMRAQIQAARTKWVYHVGKSGETGAAAVLEALR